MVHDRSRACDDLGVDVGRRYLELGLRFRRLAPSLVESYHGPPELVARVDAENVLPGMDLAEQAAELRATVARVEPHRDTSART